MLTATEFCSRYIGWLQTIEQVTKPEYYPAIRNLYETDPQDLVTPTALFTSESACIGFLWVRMVHIHEELSKEAASVA